MKKIKHFSLFYTCLFIVGSFSVRAQVGIGTSNVDASAKFQIDATDKGLLIPRVALSGLNTQSPIVGTIAASLLVYNTASVSDVTPGFYYWSGSVWVRLAIPSEVVSAIGSISGTSDSKGAILTSGVLSLTPADASNGGILTTGAQTIAGAKTLNSDVTVNNLTIGKGSGNKVTSTIMGYQSLGSSNTGDYNTAFGYRTLASNTSGFSNSAFGRLALENNLDGHTNTAIGTLALRNNTSGAYSVAVGNQALYSNTTGYQNTAVGTSSLESNIGGYYNTALGRISLFRNTEGYKNTGVGFQAGGNNLTGNNNTFLGYNSGLGITTGDNNTIIGANVTGLSSTLSNNIIIANGAGTKKAQHDGSNWSFTGNVGVETSSPTNTISMGGNSARTIGLERHTTSNTAGNNLTISSGGATSGATDKNGGDLILTSGISTGTGTSNIQFSTYDAGSAGTTSNSATERMRITSSGNVGIGTSAPSEQLVVSSASTGGTVLGLFNTSTSGASWRLYSTGSGNGEVAGHLLFYNGSARMIIKSNGFVGINTTSPSYTFDVNGDAHATNFFSSSDARFKNVLQTWKNHDEIDFVQFRWKNGRDDREHYGYLAQDVQQILPDAVYTDTEGMLSVNYDEVHSYKISNLEQKNIQQEQLIRELQQTVEALKKMVKRKRY